MSAEDDKKIREALTAVCQRVHDGGELLICAEGGEWIALTRCEGIDWHLCAAESPEGALLKLAKAVQA